MYYILYIILYYILYYILNYIMLLYIIYLSHSLSPSPSLLILHSLTISHGKT